MGRKVFLRVLDKNKIYKIFKGALLGFSLKYPVLNLPKIGPGFGTYLQAQSASFKFKLSTMIIQTQLPRKCTINRSRYVEKRCAFCIYTVIYLLYHILNEVCHTQLNVHFLQKRIDVYKMYTKFTPHFNKLLYKFCLENSAAIVLLILYTNCIHVYKSLCKFGIHFV